jgi:glutathione S-transferase
MSAGAASAPPARLVTIPFSHYCDKARWGLERAGVPFVEEGHVPVWHIVVAKRLGGKRTLPLLVTDEGVLTDSTDILRYAERVAVTPGRVYPENPGARREAEDLEAFFDEKLGPHTRRYAYAFLLTMPRLCVGVMQHDVGRGQQMLIRTAFRPIRWVMRRGMHITPESAERSRQRIEQVFDRVDELVADGRRFLVGERLSAADITLAALSVPALAPEGFPIPLPSLDEAPEAFRAQIEVWRERPAGRFVRRLYAEERRPPKP